MPTLIQSSAAKGQVGTPYSQFAGGVTVARASVTFPAGAAQNDIFEMLPIPAGHIVVDMILDSDDVDSGTAVLFNVGIMSGDWGVNDNTRTCGAEFFSGSNVGQAGGVVRPTLATAFRQAAPSVPKSIGIKVATAPGTGVAGTVGLTVLFAAAG